MLREIYPLLVVGSIYIVVHDMITPSSLSPIEPLVVVYCSSMVAYGSVVVNRSLVQAFSLG
jgi:hypothetical protein